MATKHKKDNKTKNAVLPVMRPDAAGVDIGATEIFVAVVPADHALVRSFPTFTQDLYALADWLAQCGVKTVAMESTGVYWIPLFQIREVRGFEVCPVNARHVKKTCPAVVRMCPTANGCSSCIPWDYSNRLLARGVA